MHGLPDLSRPLGTRMMHVLRTERIAAVCIRCNRFNTHRTADLKRHCRDDMPVTWLDDLLTVYCRAAKEGGPCERLIVSPDLGCSDAG